MYSLTYNTMEIFNTMMMFFYYRLQGSCGKVIFSQAYVKNSVQCRGREWWGQHAWWEDVWQGACLTGGMHGRGACVAGGHTWQGGMHGRGMHGEGQHVC